MLTMAEEREKDVAVALAAPIGSKLRWTMNSGWTSRIGIVTKKGLLEVKREDEGVPIGLGKVFYPSVSEWIRTLPVDGCLVTVKKDTRPKIVQLAVKPFQPDSTDSEKVYELSKRFGVIVRGYWDRAAKRYVTGSKGVNKLFALIGGEPKQITYRMGTMDDGYSLNLCIVRMDTGNIYTDFQEMGVDRTVEGGPNLWIMWKGQRVMLTV